eukprot:jgi/Botrbrau1/9056/Bobra.0376s0030.1
MRSATVLRLMMSGITRGGCDATPPLVSEKRALRTKVQALLKSLDDATKQKESEAIHSRLLDSRLLDNVEAIALYVPCQRLNEVDTSILMENELRKGKGKIYLPVVKDKAANMSFYHLDSVSGLRPVPPYGILEPSATYEDGKPRENVLDAGKPLDVMIIPGLAFDRQGHRLGRGGGYYDKFIQTYLEHIEQRSWKRPLIVGLAFRAQIVDKVPVEATDKTVDYIATPDGVTRVLDGMLLA